MQIRTTDSDAANGPTTAQISERTGTADPSSTSNRFLVRISFVSQNERDFQSHSIVDNVTVVDDDFLILYPGGCDILQCLRRSFYSDGHGIVKAPFLTNS
jgi:hypothetical protein